MSVRDDYSQDTRGLTLPQVRYIAAMERDGCKVGVSRQDWGGTIRVMWSWGMTGGQLKLGADGVEINQTERQQ